VVGTLLLQIGEVGQKVKLQRSTSVLGAGGDTDSLVTSLARVLISTICTVDGYSFIPCAHGVLHNHGGDSFFQKR